MAIQVISLPIAATMTQTEAMINDHDGTFKRRVAWAGETEKAELETMDKLLSSGFKIVDVQETKANNFVWLRYMLHKPETIPGENPSYAEQLLARVRSLGVDLD
jgi:hypothetical protein